MVDSEGENLWYALSDAYRNTQAANIKINSETAGELTVDGVDDVVAVIIAPGRSLDDYNQNRPSTDPIHYLEGENASTGDNTFSYTPTADSNDIVVTITRRELMQAVQKRVLGDVRNTIERYYDDYGKYPWLANFANPRAGEEIAGTASGGSGTTLVDASQDFTTMGLQPGDLIVNTSDGSQGRLLTVDSATTLSVAEFKYGTDNDFDSGDAYVIPRFNGTEDSRRGLIPYHQSNEYFSTSFGIDWKLVTGETVTVDTGITPSRHRTAMENAVKQSHEIVSAPVVVDDAEGACVWTDESTANCKGSYSDANFLTGSVTNNLASTTIRGANIHRLVDCNRDFTTAGVQVGDLVLNYSDAGVSAVDSTAEAGSDASTLLDTTQNFIASGIEPRTFLITNTTDGTEGIVATVTATEITAIALPGEQLEFEDGDTYTIEEVRIGSIYSVASTTVDCPYQGAPSAVSTTVDVLGVASANIAQPVSFDFDTVTKIGDSYRVLVTTDLVADNAGAGTSGATFIVYDNDVADYAALGVEIGDTVKNTWFNGVGTITATGVDGGGAWFTYTSLQGGSYSDIFPNEGYAVYHSHVNRRNYDFEMNFSGDTNVAAPSLDGNKRRSVCVGYGADCSAETPTTSRLPENVIDPSVLVRDFDLTDNQVGEANVVFPANTGGGTAYQ